MNVSRDGQTWEDVSPEQTVLGAGEPTRFTQLRLILWQFHMQGARPLYDVQHTLRCILFHSRKAVK